MILLFKKKKKIRRHLIVKVLKKRKNSLANNFTLQRRFPLKDKSNDKNNIQVELIEKGTER